MREQTELTPAQARRQARQKAYYQAHREEMRQQQREHYRSLDKAVHAARIRAYRQKNHETYLAYRREYRARNRERFAEYGQRDRERNGERRRAERRLYRQEHREEMREKSRAYYQAHREEILARNRAYRAAHREEILEKRRAARAAQRAAQQAGTAPSSARSYYERNRYELCRRRIGEECFRALERVRTACPERVEHYLAQWPFDSGTERRIRAQLHLWHIYPQHHLYDDCFDAGMLAYLYTIHRCAMMEYQYVGRYFQKMLRVFIICALNAGREAETLCQANDLRLCRLDHNVFDA